MIIGPAIGIRYKMRSNKYSRTCSFSCPASIWSSFSISVFVSQYASLMIAMNIFSITNTLIVIKLTKNTGPSSQCASRRAPKSKSPSIADSNVVIEEPIVLKSPNLAPKHNMNANEDENITIVKTTKKPPRALEAFASVRVSCVNFGLKDM